MPPDCLWTAIRAAMIAGTELREQFTGPPSTNADSTSSGGPPADIRSERRIIDIITQSFPGHNIVSEEEAAEFAPRTRWVIDPLDGTTNYHNGVPHYSVSIAFEGKSRPDIGVVNYVPRGQLYVGIEDHGAYMNGHEISVSSMSQLDEALVVTGFDSLLHADSGQTYYERLIESTAGVRRLGSAAAELAMVAGGGVDIYFERKLDIWDTRAGTLLVREAGGEVTHIEALDDTTGAIVVASNPVIHKKLISFLSQHRVLG